jgi:hypothetical protein
LHASFAGRRLEIGRGRFENYRRGVALVVSLGARATILRARLSNLVSAGVGAYRRGFEEQLLAVFGFELSPRLAGVLFVHEAGGHELAALFSAVSRDHALTERYDEDWFRNPRCLEELRGEIESVPEREPAPDVIRDGAERLARALVSPG